MLIWKQRLKACRPKRAAICLSQLRHQRRGLGVYSPKDGPAGSFSHLALYTRHGHRLRHRPVQANIYALGERHAEECRRLRLRDVVGAPKLSEEEIRNDFIQRIALLLIRQLVKEGLPPGARGRSITGICVYSDVGRVAGRHHAHRYYEQDSGRVGPCVEVFEEAAGMYERPAGVCVFKLPLSSTLSIRGLRRGAYEEVDERR